jgi:SHAQKYF class myb-like DNA-binding protein
MARGRWTDPEHNRFLAGMKAYGRSWKQIADNVVKTRTPEQVRIHAQKHFSKQGKTSKRKGKAGVLCVGFLPVFRHGLADRWVTWLFPRFFL